MSMAHKTHSLFRETFYRALKHIELRGSVLDLGGSRISGYHELFPGKPVFTVVNIDDYYGYDLKFDVEDPFPVADASYDHVLCLNLLEHVYDPKHVLRESFRVMKAGGLLVSITPFSMPVHGCPRDFYRYTDVTLKRMAEEIGFRVERVEPMGHGVCACVYQYASWLLPGLLRRLAMRCAIGGDSLLSACSGRYRKLSPNYALGYLAILRKPL